MVELCPPFAPRRKYDLYLDHIDALAHSKHALCENQRTLDGVMGVLAEATNAVEASGDVAARQQA